MNPNNIVADLNTNLAYLQSLKDLNMIYNGFNKTLLEEMELKSLLYRKTPINTSLKYRMPTFDLQAYYNMSEEEKKSTILSFYQLGTNMVPDSYLQNSATANSYKSLSDQIDPYKTVTSSSIQSGINEFNQQNLNLFHLNGTQYSANKPFNKITINNNFDNTQSIINKLLTDSQLSINNLTNNNKELNNLFNNKNDNKTKFNFSSNNTDNNLITKKKYRDKSFKKFDKNSKEKNNLLDIDDEEYNSIKKDHVLNRNNYKLESEENFRIIDQTNIVCNVCGKFFKSEIQLKTHLKSHKVNVSVDVKDEVLSFGCNHGLCGLKFKTKGRMLMHHNKQEPECKVEKNSIIKLISQYKALMIKLTNNNKKIKLPEQLICDYKNLGQQLQDSDYFNTLCGTDLC